MKRYVISIAALLTLTLNSCNNGEAGKNNNNQKVESEGVTETSSNQAKADYVITNNAIEGIKPLDLRNEHGNKLQRGKIREGDVIKEVFVLERNGTELGTVEAYNGDENVVGNIIINSPDVATDKGIRVGSSYFGDLKAAYKNLTVRNSRKRRKIFVRSEQLAFVLDFESDKKNLELNDIPESATVIEIVILAKKPKKKSS